MYFHKGYTITDLNPPHLMISYYFQSNTNYFSSGELLRIFFQVDRKDQIKRQWAEKIFVS